MNATAEVTLAEVLEKRRRLEQYQRLERLKLDNGLAFYRPHRKQELFHRAGRFKRRYVRTGNRFGKSLMGVVEDVSWARGERAFLPKDDPARYEGIPKRAVKILLIVVDWDQTEKIFTNLEDGKLWKVIPKEALCNPPYQKNQAGKIDKVFVKSIHGGISTIYIDTVKSFKNNPMGHESADWDAIHVDEPCPEDMWIANSRGLVDRGGSAWFTCTPVTEMWINDYFLPPTRSREEFDKPFVDDRRSRWMITGSMHDNPTLNEEDKALFIESLSAEERETRVDGRPRALTGCVYSEYDQVDHVYFDPPLGWTDYNEPPRNATIRIAIDTHPRTPHAVLFAATMPSQRTYFYDEIFEHCLISDLCQQILARLNGRIPLIAHLEPAAWIEDEVTGLSAADEFMNFGLPISKASKDLRYGIMRVKKLLRDKDEKGIMTARFSTLLHETPFEFDRYVWKPGEDKPIDKYDHMMENLYRLVLGGLEYVPADAGDAVPIRPLKIEKEGLTTALMSLPGERRKRRTDKLRRYPA